MDIFSYNNHYLIKNKRPWVPVMGEFHYTRYPSKYWKEALLKMKAGGISIISTYVIWIHHEEIEGEYDFTGQRDLKLFLEVCKECDLHLFLRIGPWCHGEVRNGGFPDWLLSKAYPLRENNTAYLGQVNQYYKRIYKEIKGLLHKDGGPIIGVQIENEYGHAGGLTGEAGEAHMKTLVKMAKDIGFDVPYYTATGWGGACTGGLIPVFGGYCEAPWDKRVTELEPSKNYFFDEDRDDAAIASDFDQAEEQTKQAKTYAYPYLMAELGGGLQVTSHRRPIASGKDIGAMSLTKLGSGANLLGYYMYHGGTNPKGKRTTLQESRVTGYANDYPVCSYDFQGPIGAYGQISDSFKEIKLLSYFLKDFGEDFARMATYIPKSQEINYDDTQTLRHSFRVSEGEDKQQGYLFINNYQRRRTLKSHKNEVITFNHHNSSIEFPEMDINDQDFFFVPFNMPIGHKRIVTTTCTPFCLLNNDKKTYIFYSNGEITYEMEALEEHLAGENEGEIITIAREEALNGYKISGIGMDYIMISPSLIVQEGSLITFIGNAKPTFSIYPDLPEVPKGFERLEGENGLYRYKKIETVGLQRKTTQEVNYSKVFEDEQKIVYEINMAQLKEDNQFFSMSDIFLNIDFEGDKARLYMNEDMISDYFYIGTPYKIGLKQYGFPTHLKLEIDRLDQDAPIFIEKQPNMENGFAKRANKIWVEYEYTDEFVIGGQHE